MSAAIPRRPPALVVRPDTIPAELRGCAQWVGWAWEWVGERWTKVPRQAADPSRRASTTNAETWASFERAFEAYRRGQTDGIGFVFTAEDPYAGIDLDKCRDPETGEIAPWARAILEALDSYTEISPSGSGVHVVVRATKPAGRCRTGALEMYDHGRFFCVTGWALSDYPTTIEDRQAAVDALYVATFGRSETPGPARPAASSAAGAVDDAALLERAFTAKNGAKIRALWHGDTSDYGGDHSAADLALLSALRFYTGDDPARLDTLFRQSGLMRPKWDEPRGAQTYGERTIAKALEGPCEVYRGAAAGPSTNGHHATGGHAAVSDAPADAPEGAAPPPGTGCTDLANAERFLREHGDDVRFCPQLGKGGRWLEWRDGAWRIDDLGAVYARAAATVRGIYAEAASAPTKEARQSLAAWAKTSENRTRLDSLLYLAAKRCGVSVGTLDRDPWLLNVANGTLDLRDGRLRPADRDDLCTKQLDIPFDPAARCPRWLRFLDEIFAGDRALIAYIQKALGYSLTGDVREECFFIAWGQGSNGKSKLFETILAVLGPYAKPAPFATFLADERESDRARNDLAGLKGARFVSAVEMNEGRRFDEATIKQVTGGDTVSARFLFAEFFELTPTWKIWLATNYKPVIRGVDDGIWRRVRLIPFTVKFWRRDDPEAPAAGPWADETLGAQLRAERAGILAWLVEGCLRWQRDGLDAPEAVRQATAGYREEMDPIGQFLEERCVRDPAARTPARTLRAAYEAWAEATGEKPMSPQAFGRRLAARGLTAIRTKQERSWQGIRVIEVTKETPRAGDR